jgi:hypothetical protein
VHDIIRETCPDISETKKEEFNFIQLQQLDPMGKYSWNWLPAKGTAGGILFQFLSCSKIKLMVWFGDLF